jgi:glycosyltransferase involved in cell wall biosynthesis
MRILVVYRHFWPDSPPYASMLRTIAAHLAGEGHDVTVLTEQPSYKTADRGSTSPAREVLDGVTVRRMGRLPGMGSGVVRRLGAVLFPLRTMLHALGRRLKGERYDVVWTATMPPAINGLGTRIAARVLGAKFVYHFQDIYPELQTFAGNWKAGGMLDRAVGGIDRRNAQKAAACIALSDDMADTIAARGIAREKIHVINNFMLASFGEDAALPHHLAKPEGTFRVIFAGNVGRFQGLEAFVDAARLLADDRPDIEFMLLGEGAALDMLRRKAEGLPNIRFEGHMPFDAAKPVIASADLGLVSIQPGVYRTAYPSKTLTYLGLGVPVLAVVEPESALARHVEENRVGRVAPGSDGTALATAIREAHDARDDVAQARARALDYYERDLSREAALGRWSALMRSLEA